MPRFAAVQMESTLLDVEANLSKISALTEEAAASKADAAVFPECALSGYALTADEAAVVAEPIPGPSIERLISLCSSNRILIAVGMIEKGSGERLFNSCALLGPGGILGVYRKTHLPHLGVDRFLSAGGQIAGPFDTEVGRLGVLICYDLRFPEPPRCS